MKTTKDFYIEWLEGLDEGEPEDFEAFQDWYADKMGGLIDRDYDELREKGHV